MAKIPTTNLSDSRWADVYTQLIDDCEARDRDLSAWEADFLSSIRDQLDENRPLTQKQIDILDGIWEKVTKSG